MSILSESSVMTRPRAARGGAAPQPTAAPLSCARAASALLRLALLALLCTSASSFVFRSRARPPTRAEQRRSSLMQLAPPEAAAAPSSFDVTQELCSAYSAPTSLRSAPGHRAPGFLIIGAQKAGTTFLHSLLSKVRRSSSRPSLLSQLSRLQTHTLPEARSQRVRCARA